MSLLHAIQQAGNRTAAWELSSLASSLGLPAPPDLKLPDLPPVVGACDFTMLAAALGQQAADLLKAQLLDPAVQANMTGDLQAKKSQLLGYLSSLDTQKSALLAQIDGLTGQQGALGAAQTAVGGVRAALGGAVDSPLGQATLTTLTMACPVAAGLVAYAESTLDTLGADLGGLSSYATALLAKVDGLTSLKTAGEAVLAEIDAHLSILPTLFTSLEDA